MRLDQLRNLQDTQIPAGGVAPLPNVSGQIQKQSFSQAIAGFEANAKTSPLRRPKLSVTREPIDPSEDSDSRPDMFQTDGAYFIQFTNGFHETFCDPRKAMEMPFVISGDIFMFAKIPNRYANYDMLMRMAKAIAILGVVVEYSTITPELFDIARKNPNVSFGFSFDFVRYYNDRGRKTSFYTEDLYRKQIEHENAKMRGGNYINRIKRGQDPITKEKM